MNFGVLESNGGGILEAFQTLLSSIFIPALKRQKDWGTLSEDAKGQQMKTEFLTKLSSFVSVLANAQASISDVVELSALECIDTRNFTTSAQIMGAAGNSELTHGAGREDSTAVVCRDRAGRAYVRTRAPTFVHCMLAGSTSACSCDAVWTVYFITKSYVIEEVVMTC